VLPANDYNTKVEMSIVAFYNKNQPICYLVGRFEVTRNLKNANEFYSGNILLSNAQIILDNIYNGDDHGNMSDHEYFHIKEDFFNKIKKRKVKIIIRTKSDELSNIRKLKLEKLSYERD